jgi:hypothetical protein
LKGSLTGQNSKKFRKYLGKNSEISVDNQSVEGLAMSEVTGKKNIFS